MARIMTRLKASIMSGSFQAQPVLDGLPQTADRTRHGAAVDIHHAAPRDQGAVDRRIEGNLSPSTIPLALHQSRICALLSGSRSCLLMQTDSGTEK